MKKKLLAMSLAILMVISSASIFGGCSLKKKKNKETQESGPSYNTTTYSAKIGSEDFSVKFVENEEMVAIVYGQTPYVGKVKKVDGAEVVADNSGEKGRAVSSNSVNYLLSVKLGGVAGAREFGYFVDNDGAFIVDLSKDTASVDKLFNNYLVLSKIEDSDVSLGNGVYRNRYKLQYGANYTASSNPYTLIVNSGEVLEERSGSVYLQKLYVLGNNLFYLKYVNDKYMGVYGLYSVCKPEEMPTPTLITLGAKNTLIQDSYYDEFGADVYTNWKKNYYEYIDTDYNLISKDVTMSISIFKYNHDGAMHEKAVSGTLKLFKEDNRFELDIDSGFSDIPDFLIMGSWMPTYGGVILRSSEKMFCNANMISVVALTAENPTISDFKGLGAQSVLTIAIDNAQITESYVIKWVAS